MRRVPLIVGILGVFTVILGVAVLLLGLLLYQTTPKDVLAQQTFIGRMQSVLVSVRIADRALNIFYRGPRPEEALPHYNLALDRKQLATIDASLPIDDVYLSDDAKIWADGSLTSDGETYPVRARVRGDRYNHWRFRKKSWRLSFEDDRLFRGIKEVNLIIPEDRAWFVEALSAYRADAFGLFHPPMRFVTASINGGDAMLYLEIEHWTKEMLEKQAKPGDVNLYKTGSVGTSHFNLGWDPIEADIAYWGKYQGAVAPPLDSYEEAELMLRFAEEGAHEDPAFQRKIETLFDREGLIRWYGLSLLAGNLHVSGDNLRFFFDVSRGRYQPIVWDIFSTMPRPEMLDLRGEVGGNSFWREVFSIPSMHADALRFVLAYVNDEERVEQDLAEAERLRAQIERAAYSDSVKLPSNRQVKRDLDQRMREVRANIDFLRENVPALLTELEASEPVGSDELRASSFEQ
ncbi:MAG: CotH kinase family protein [Candidatus Peregrinibacteria bacterium]|nr:CotH kinase family protein [Candidatus Peregrinibacteria bacterium]